MLTKVGVTGELYWVLVGFENDVDHGLDYSVDNDIDVNFRIPDTQILAIYHNPLFGKNC